MSDYEVRRFPTDIVSSSSVSGSDLLLLARGSGSESYVCRVDSLGLNLSGGRVFRRLHSGLVGPIYYLSSEDVNICILVDLTSDFELILPSIEGVMDGYFIEVIVSSNVGGHRLVVEGSNNQVFAGYSSLYLGDEGSGVLLTADFEGGRWLCREFGVLGFHNEWLFHVGSGGDLLLSHQLSGVRYPFMVLSRGSELFRLQNGSGLHLLNLSSSGLLELVSLSVAGSVSCSAIGISGGGLVINGSASVNKIATALDYDEESDSELLTSKGIHALVSSVGSLGSLSNGVTPTVGFSLGSVLFSDGSYLIEKETLEFKVDSFVSGLALEHNWSGNVSGLSGEEGQYSSGVSNGATWFARYTEGSWLRSWVDGLISESVLLGLLEDERNWVNGEQLINRGGDSDGDVGNYYKSGIWLYKCISKSLGIGSCWVKALLVDGSVEGGNIPLGSVHFFPTNNSGDVGLEPSGYIKCGSSYGVVSESLLASYLCDLQNITRSNSVDVDSFDAVNDLVYVSSHGYSVGDWVFFESLGVLPSGLSSGHLYIVSSSTTDSFALLDSVDGSSVSLLDSGSGTSYVDSEFYVPSVSSSSGYTAYIKNK